MVSFRNSQPLDWIILSFAFLAISLNAGAAAGTSVNATSDGPYFECQIDPTAKSNFSLALFRIWLPPADSPVKGVLAVLPGSDADGTPIADDPRWQAVAAKWNYALLGIAFTTRPSTTPYYRAEDGTGKALLSALDELSVTSGHPELKNVPIAILGHSQGGQFAFHFTCFQPQRVIVFATIKGGYYDVKPTDAARAVPGLLFTGELDSEFRRENIRRLFDANPWPSSKWAYVSEPKMAHELGRCLDLIIPFFGAVITDELQPYVGTIDNLQVEPVGSASKGPRAWLPNKEVAAIWGSLMQGKLTDAERNLRIPIHAPPKLAAISPSTYDFGKVQANDKAPTATFRIQQVANGQAWTSIRAFSRSQKSKVTVEETAEGDIVEIQPLLSGLPLGKLSDTVELRFLRDGKAILGGAQIALTFEHTHPDIQVKPSSIYIGTHSSLCESSVRISVSSGKRLAIESVTMATGEAASIVITEQSGESALLKCTFFPLPEPGTHSGVFSVRLSEPAKAEVIIPFIGFYKPATP